MFRIRWYSCFYAGKPLSGLIYLFTWGLFGFGQLIDLALIPAMVDEKNLKYLALRGGNQSNTQTVVVNLGGQVTGQTPGSGSDLSSIQLPPQQVSQQAITPAMSKQNDIITLLKLAQNKGGSISIADAVIELSKPTSEIRSILVPDFSPKSSNPYKIWIMGFHTASKINLMKNARNRFSIRIV